MLYLMWLRGSSFFSRALSVCDSLLSSPTTSQLLSSDCSAPATARATKTSSKVEVWQGGDILDICHREHRGLTSQRISFSPLQTNFRVMESMISHFLSPDCKKEKLKRLTVHKRLNLNLLRIQSQITGLIWGPLLNLL